MSVAFGSALFKEPDMASRQAREYADLQHIRKFVKLNLGLASYGKSYKDLETGGMGKVLSCTRRHGVLLPVGP